MNVGCFSRHQRLITPTQFRRVFKSGMRVGDNSMTVIALNNKKAYARLGLAVPKKHVKLAVQRNRLKRIIRESFRQHQTTLAGNDIVVLIKRDMTAKTNAQIFSQLDQHWLAVEQQCVPS